MPSLKQRTDDYSSSDSEDEFDENKPEHEEVENTSNSITNQAVYNSVIAIAEHLKCSEI